MTKSASFARPLSKPIPENCTAAYAAGWSFGDWWDATGGNLRAEAPVAWSDEKANGFYDRLTAERAAGPAACMRAG